MPTWCSGRPSFSAFKMRLRALNPYSGNPTIVRIGATVTINGPCPERHCPGYGEAYSPSNGGPHCNRRGGVLDGLLSCFAAFMIVDHVFYGAYRSFQQGGVKGSHFRCFQAVPEHDAPRVDGVRVSSLAQFQFGHIVGPTSAVATRGFPDTVTGVFGQVGCVLFGQFVAPVFAIKESLYCVLAQVSHPVGDVVLEEALRFEEGTIDTSRILKLLLQTMAELVERAVRSPSN